MEPTETSLGSKEERCVVCEVILKTMDIPCLEKSEESSVVTSSAESSALEAMDGFPVGAVVAIVVLILAAGGVAVWFVRKKA